MKKQDQNRMREGYTSFNPEELLVEARESSINGEAYELLHRASTTSSNVKTGRKKSVKIDDVYPVSSEETEQMRSLLEQAEAAAGDPTEPKFAGYLAELKGIVHFSSHRWNTSQWSLVIVATLLLFASFTRSCENNSHIDSLKKHKQTVKNWDKPKENASGPTVSSRLFRSADSYREYLIDEINEDEYSAKVKAGELRYSADTASTDKAKEIYLKQVEELSTSIEEYKAQVAEIKELDDKALKKMALKHVKESISDARSSRNRAVINTLFFLALVVLYFFSQRPYGYTITRHRLESKIMGGIQRFFSRFAFGAISLSAAVGTMKDRSTVTHWTDGTSTENHDYAATTVNSGLSIVKLIPFIIGIVILYIGSFLFMLYYTIQGLRRNYTRENIVEEFKAWCKIM